MKSEIVFVEQKTGNKLVLKDYIPLNVEQAVNELRNDSKSYKIYRKYKINTHDVFFAIKTYEISPPKIFVLKRFKGYEKITNFKYEIATFKKVASMQPNCRRRLVEGVGQEHNGIYWIVMEYYDGSIADFIDSGGILSENQRQYILVTIVNAVHCLYLENLAYIDMKVDQILYRYKDGKFEVKLGDLEVVELGGNNRIKITHKAPTSSRKVNKNGFFHRGDDSAVAFGILMLMAELWFESTSNEKLISRSKYNKPELTLPKLKKLMPPNVFFIAKMLYSEWETIKIPELRRIIVNEIDV